MHLDIKRFEEEVENHFNRLKQRVRKRLEKADHLDWLLEDNNVTEFQPDYLTVATAGKNKLEQYLNRLISKWSPDLWFRLFWPKICRKLVSYTEDKYFQKIFHGLEDQALISEIKYSIIRLMNSVLSRNWSQLRQCTFTELSNCLLDIIHEPFNQLPIEQDIFLPDKKMQNSACLQLLQELSPDLQTSENRLETLIYLACRSNWIDSLEDGMKGHLQEFLDEIKTNWDGSRLHSFNLVDPQYFQLKETVKIFKESSGPLLYETDNCGEVVFDLCLIQEWIAREQAVFLCVKGCPMVNDSMKKDVRELLKNDLFMDLKKALEQGLLKFVTPGCFRGGGKLVHEVNSDFKQAFIQSSLVIIKGQGNFQSMPMARPGPGGLNWYQYRKPIVYMTGVRADMINMCFTALYRNQNKPKKNRIFLKVNS